MYGSVKFPSAGKSRHVAEYLNDDFQVGLLKFVTISTMESYRLFAVFFVAILIESSSACVSFEKALKLLAGFSKFFSS